MHKRKTFWILAAVAFIFIAFLWGRWSAPGGISIGAAMSDEAVASGAETIWTCSMHPQVRQPEFGQCPICAMDLIPISGDEDGEKDDSGPPRLRLSERSLALMNVRTAPVLRRESEALLRLPGRLEVDETRKAVISAWFWGRVDRLYVDFAGTRVREGEHLAEIYSPQLFGAQEEFLQTMRAQERAGGTADAALAEAARDKLRLLGLSARQIDAIAEADAPSTHLTMYSTVTGTILERRVTSGQYVNVGTALYSVADLSYLWAELEAFESELALLRLGQPVEIEVKAFPGQNLEGRIAFVDTSVDPVKRTARVRVNMPNPDGRFKPGMLISGTVRTRVGGEGAVTGGFSEGMWISPMHPEIVKDGPGQCDICGMDLVPVEEMGFFARASLDEELPLVIPATAPLFTGQRSLVYVRLPEGDRPVFEARRVTLGPRLGDEYVVKDGLREGEQVVVHGQFKIDSELQIRGRPSMMAPGGGGAPLHDHGDIGNGTHKEHVASVDPRLPPVREEWGASVDSSFGEELRPLLAAYLDLAEALAADDTSASREALHRYHQVLMGIGEHRLSGAAHVAWMETYGLLHDVTHKMAEPAGTENMRAHLQAMTTAMEYLYVNFGAGQLPGVHQAHCPMVEGGVEVDGDPIGTWLQRTERLANPYWGAMMLRCGDFHGRLEPES